MPKKRRPSKSGQPKGSYRLPSGGLAHPSVGPADATGRRLRLTSVRHEEPDLHKLTDAILELAREQRKAEDERKAS